MWVAKHAEGKKNKISRKEELVIFFFFQNVLYKVDRHQTKPQRSGRGPLRRWEGQTKWERGQGAQIKDHVERNYNRMIEVVCEGWRFGGRTNENARDWLWVVLVAWAAKSDSFICLPWSWHRWHTPPPWHRSHWPVQKKNKRGSCQLLFTAQSLPAFTPPPSSESRVNVTVKCDPALTRKSSPASNLASISLPMSDSGTRRSSLMSPLSLIRVM